MPAHLCVECGKKSGPTEDYLYSSETMEKYITDLVVCNRCRFKKGLPPLGSNEQPYMVFGETDLYE